MDINISIAGIQTVLVSKCVQKKMQMVRFYIDEKTIANAIELTKYLVPWKSMILKSVECYKTL